MTVPRIAIIGMGGFAGVHHKALLGLERAGKARLVATCDPQLEKFAEQQVNYAFATREVRLFSDYRTMLDECAGELDLVIIPTPIFLHAEMHQACVERGLAVYLEKPPTLDPSELEAMIAVDRAAAVPTAVGFNFIIEPARLALKQRLIDGEFGRLRSVRLHALWPRTDGYFRRNNWAGRLRAPNGRPMMDSCFGNAMAHFVHNALHWAGTGGLLAWAEPVEVKAALLRAHRIESADTFFVEASASSGVSLRFAFTHAATGPHVHCETLECEEATLRYQVDSGCEVQWRDGRRAFVEAPTNDLVTSNLEAYLSCLRGEAPRPPTRLEDSRPFVQLHALSYLASGEITPLPADRVHRHPGGGPYNGEFISVDGLSELLLEFAAGGEWPDLRPFGRIKEPGVARPSDLPKLPDLLAALASQPPRSQIPC
jgi:predicted dehydrogenase